MKELLKIQILDFLFHLKNEMGPMQDIEIYLMIQQAQNMQKRAQAPYSKFYVGAIVQTDCGKTFGGCNIESASYGLTICAERVAIFHAIAQGYTNFSRLVLATDTGAYPCGACRQIIYEYCPKSSIIIATPNKIEYTSNKELLPHGFSKNDF